MKRIYHRLQRIVFYYTQFFSHRIRFINNSFSKQLALTFDDGPDPLYTRQILDILRQYNVYATFFLSGQAIEKAQDIVYEILTAGHGLGNHGYEHVAMDRLSEEEVISGFGKTDSLLRKLSGGKAVNFYRPPYGIVTKTYLTRIITKRKFTVQWSLDSYDYRKEFETDRINEMLLRDVRNGDIILFHDTKPYTRDVLKIIIPALMERNFRFITLDQKFK